MSENDAPEVTMNANELLRLHPLPWSHHLLLIKDAEGKQVVHTGGLYNEFGRLYEGRYLSGLNALIVKSINARANLAAPDAAQGEDVSDPLEIFNAGFSATTEMPDETFARGIIKHISDAALELAFMRHGLTSDEVGVGNDAPPRIYAEAHDDYRERIKEDTLACLTGDDTGCLDPEELDKSNCELLWLQAQIADAVRQARREGICWHCGVVLAYVPKLRCEDCPDECDNEDCDEIGCRPPC